MNIWQYVWNWFKLILNEIQLHCFVWDLCGKLKPYLCSTSHTFPKAKKRQNLNKRNAKRKKSTLAIIIIIISINICFNCFPISRRNTMVQSYYTWKNINLLSMHHQGKYDVWSYWGFQHFTQLCNLLAKDSSHMIQHCHQDICKTKQAQDCQKNLFYVFNFSFFNRQSTFHGCYCGLWKCRVIIATCVPTTATVGPPFVWMVWEWEDTNIRWHRKKGVWDNLVSGCIWWPTQ